MWESFSNLLALHCIYICQLTGNHAGFFSQLFCFVSLVIIGRLFRKVSQNHSKNTDLGVLSSENNSGILLIHRQCFNNLPMITRLTKQTNSEKNPTWFPMSWQMQMQWSTFLIKFKTCNLKIFIYKGTQHRWISYL